MLQSQGFSVEPHRRPNSVYTLLPTMVVLFSAEIRGCFSLPSNLSVPVLMGHFSAVKQLKASQLPEHKEISSGCLLAERHQTHPSAQNGNQDKDFLAETRWL